MNNLEAELKSSINDRIKAETSKKENELDLITDTHVKISALCSFYCPDLEEELLTMKRIGWQDYNELADKIQLDQLKQIEMMRESYDDNDHASNKDTDEEGNNDETGEENEHYDRTKDGEGVN